MVASKWNLNNAVFESDKYNYEMMKYSPWSGHRRFGYDYVANERPAIVVELGSYYGCSAFSFLQAIKDNNLDTHFYAIDTWEGDSFTLSDYQENIFSEYKKIQDACYSKQNAEMLQMTFDEASAMFEDKKIDLLHIDGSHKYEDVKHDFFTWKQKVKDDGVIFFHDVSEDLLFGEPMGSHIFWKEIKEQYPYTFEFPFSFGLGVLFFDLEKYEQFKRNVSIDYYQQYINRDDSANKDVIRKNYFEIRDIKRQVEFLKEQNSAAREQIEKYESDAQEKHSYIKELTDAIANFEQTVAGKETYIRELRGTIQEYDKNCASKEKYIGELELKIHDLTEENKAQCDENGIQISRYKETVEGKEKYITELQETISEFKNQVCGKDAYIEELLNTQNNYEEAVAGKETYIRELRETIQEYDENCASKEKYIGELELKIHNLTEENKAQCDENDIQISRYKETVEGKEKYITELQETISEFKNQVCGKDAYIEELLNTQNDYKEVVAGKDSYIEELQRYIRDYKDSVADKDAYIFNLQNELSADKQTIREKDVYISKLLSALKSMNFEICNNSIKNELINKLNADGIADEADLKELQKLIEKEHSSAVKLKNEMMHSLWGKRIINRIEQDNNE